jgi:hypothetical protein
MMIKPFVTVFTLFVTALCLCAFSCQAQNGPTQHQVVLAITPSVTPGVTGICIYRGSAAGTYAMPALSCSSSPITTFTDTSVVSGTTYHYAATAQIVTGVGTEESSYSNDVSATIPVSPAAPGLGNSKTAKKEVPEGPIVARTGPLGLGVSEVN